jgi:hypothetical protein
MSKEEKPYLLTNQNIVNASNLMKEQALRKEVENDVHFSDLSNESIEQLYQHYNIDFTTFTQMSMDELKDLYEKFKNEAKNLNNLELEDSDALQSLEEGLSGIETP